MFWTFLIAMTLAASFVKLGATAVTVNLLSIALQCAILTIMILTSVLLWRRSTKK